MSTVLRGEKIRARYSKIFELIFDGRVPTFVPTTGRTRRNHGASVDARSNVSHVSGPSGHRLETYTLFEGSSEIQRLVVARSISGVHIP